MRNDRILFQVLKPSQPLKFSLKLNQQSSLKKRVKVWKEAKSRPLPVQIFCQRRLLLKFCVAGLVLEIRQWQQQAIFVAFARFYTNFIGNNNNSNNLLGATNSLTERIERKRDVIFVVAVLVLLLTQSRRENAESKEHKTRQVNLLKNVESCKFIRILYVLFDGCSKLREVFPLLAWKKNDQKQKQKQKEKEKQRQKQNIRSRCWSGSVWYPLCAS